ncbi:MAG: Crp/Fnr family transcriptional regulator [Muribaculaceae bacterium]|nr:Crp/Fnr family transcriptional regulator [Muribaculaceae bacterium]
MDTMYEILMGLPLFKGVSYQCISKVIERTKFHFLKYLDGEPMVEPGEECTHIKFIISGAARVSIANSDGRFKVSQTLNAPDVLAPDFLFGKATKYPCSAVSIGTTGVLQISKQDYVKILNADPIFLFNFLNVLSMNAQKAVDGILAVTTGSLEERIAFWIVALTQPTGTDVALTCRQRDLYSYFGVQRSSFMATLEELKRRGLIDYSQNEIRVISRKEMRNLLTTAVEG